MEVPVRTNDHHSIVVQMFFWVGYFDKIENIFLILYIYISIYAADRGSLELDSRVLGDLVLSTSDCVIYVFHYFISLSILSIKVGGLGIY